MYLVVALSMVLVADRSGGVTALIVCALYYYYTGDKRKRKKNTLVLIGVGVVLAIVSSAVAFIGDPICRAFTFTLYVIRNFYVFCNSFT